MPNLDEIKARRERITAGEWRAEFGEAVKIRAKHGGYVAILGWLKGPYGSMGRISNNEGEANAHFIANAPTDIDWLIAEVERLRSGKAQAEAERDALADACAGIVGSPEEQEFPSLVHKGNITKWLKYAQQQAERRG